MVLALEKRRDGNQDRSPRKSNTRLRYGKWKCLQRALTPNRSVVATVVAVAVVVVVVVAVVFLLP